MSCVVSTYLYGAFDCMFLSCHVHIQSKSTLYNCLNVKELHGRSRCEIWSLSDCNWTQTHKHLVLLSLERVEREEITHMWRTWGTPQNFLLAFIDELWKTRKIRILKKLKIIAGDIIILHMCNKNHNHMRYQWLQLDSNSEPLSS